MGVPVPNAEENAEGRKSTYWICDECAAKKKMVPPNGCVTAIKGLCGHCDCPIESLLIPVIDYDNPGGVPWD